MDTLSLNTTSLASTDHLNAHRGRTQDGSQKKTQTAEQELSQRIFREGNGRGLVMFCRELAVILIRQYNQETAISELRARLGGSLQATLHCTAVQADCLIDLALELIHAKVHGRYRRTDVELSFLIATATGAVEDVSHN